jgi:signal transduction histidine kinase
VSHSGASRIRIWITGDDASATLEVVDDGSGFDVEAAEARRPGMGLFSIRERVSLVGGTVEIHSVHGRGTRVTATVPLAPPEAV